MVFSEQKAAKALLLQFTKRRAALAEISPCAAEILRASKQAIFALHRGDTARANTLRAVAAEQTSNVERIRAKHPGIGEIGSYRAALEERAEAELFALYLQTGTLTLDIDSVLLEPDVLIGGLSDATGEIVRHAITRSTAGAYDVVSRAAQTVEDVVGFLLSLDLTGVHRQKFDQAKRNLQTLEHMLYEITLRGHLRMDVSAE
jgi:translin